MKKILSLILALLVVWVVGLLYAGHKTEELLAQYIDKTNKSYQNYLNIKLKFESNFFSAKAKYTVKVDLQKSLETLNLSKDDFAQFENTFKDLFKDPFVINQNIQYGPILFGGNNMEFGMTRISYHSTLNDFISVAAKGQLSTEAMKALISNLNKILEKEVTFDFASVVPFFSNKIHSSGSISEIRIKADKVSLTISEMIFDSTNESEIFFNNGRFNVSNITLKGQKEVINMQNLSFSYNFDKAVEKDVYFGNAEFDIQNLGFGDLAGEDSNLTINLAIGLNQNKKPGLADLKFGLKFEALKYSEKVKVASPDLPKKLQFFWSLNKVNTVEFLTFLTKDAKNINDAIDNLSKIFVKKVSDLNLNVDITTIKQPKIHNTLDFNVVYNFDKSDVKKLLMANDLLEVEQLIKDRLIANLKLKVNTKILKSLEPKLESLVKNKVIIKEHDFYQTDINYQKKKLMVNDIDMTVILQQLKALNKQ